MEQKNPYSINWIVFDYTRVGVLSVARVLKGLICVINVNRFGAVTLFNGLVTIMKWVPQEEFYNHA